MQTVPSILEKDINGLISQINKLSPYFNRFQIDIADGIFVPNKTVQIEDIVRFLKGSVKTDPYKNLSFDFHLMVKDYKAEIKKIEKLKKIIKVNLILIHFSAISPRFWRDQISDFSSIPIGLTLSPQDQVSDLAGKYDLNKIPFIQIMSVIPGFQGSPFLDKTLNKIEQLKDMGYRKEIFLDGAINEKTIPIILSKEYQPDFICPGSYLTKTKNLNERVQYLKKL